MGMFEFLKSPPVEKSGDKADEDKEMQPVVLSVDGKEQEYKLTNEDEDRLLGNQELDGKTTLPENITSRYSGKADFSPEGSAIVKQFPTQSEDAEERAYVEGDEVKLPDNIKSRYSGKAKFGPEDDGIQTFYPETGRTASGAETQSESQPEAKSVTSKFSEWRKRLSAKKMMEKIRQFGKKATQPFSKSKYYQVDNKADVTVDQKGDVERINDNLRGEILTALRELSGDNQDIWQAIKQYPVDMAISMEQQIRSNDDTEFDASIDGLQIRMDRLIEEIVRFVGEERRSELAVHEGEKLKDWVAKCLRLLTKNRWRGDTE
jgi:hypothetical protein